MTAIPGARVFQLVLGVLLVGALSAACAGRAMPGAPGYAYNVEGRYLGRLMVVDEPFDAAFDLRTRRGGRVDGVFVVRAPLEVEGSVDGRVVDDVLRVTLTYAGPGDDRGRTCESRVEGILTVSPGGAVVDGPVTVTDCGDALPGRLSFRRASD